MILVPKHRTKNAVRFKDANLNIGWLLFGQPSVWTDELNPPNPDPDSTSLNSTFAAKKATFKEVYEDNAGSISVIINSVERKFSEFGTRQQAIDGDCTQVIVYATVTGVQMDDAGSLSFRQIGFATDLTPSSGHSSDTFLDSSIIDDFGNLESIENRRVVNLELGSTYEAFLLFEF
jgi:hypothetical protein